MALYHSSQVIDLPHYEEALLEVYGVKEKVQPTGRRGRPKKPKLLPPEELHYAQVVKRRKKGRVVSIISKVIFGTVERVKALLENSQVSLRVSTSPL